MPFRSSSLPEQIRAASGNFRDAVDAPKTGASEGAAIRAKTQAYAWQQGHIRSPQRDSAAPWFANQPFSQLRSQNPGQFQNWDASFKTNVVGWDFERPEPESSDSSSAQPGSSGQQKSNNSEEVN